MHKKRRKAYRNLINALLNCNQGEEWGLLQAHPELIDSHFIQMMQKVAEELEKKGDEEGAYFLQNLAYTLVSPSAYQGIIAQLLNCASDDEALQILDANRDWVDAGLQQTIMEVAEDLRTQGDSDKANFLMNIVEQMMGVHRNTSDAQLNFLLQVLEAIELSWGWGDTTVIYPLLADNTDKLDARLAKQLRAWAITSLEEAKPDEAERIAAVIVLFSNLIQQFPLGDKASNMEIAITGYEIALKVFTRAAFPVDWAGTQNHLGEAYRNRILGERADNLERAIACFQQALTIRTLDAFPVDWAGTQNNLGNAYRDRILGERADNLEWAIAYLQQALTVFTLDAFPVDWATTQNNLGNVYRERIRGERADNLERAIACFQQALTIRTLDAFPVDWAITQNNLGAAYINKILGEWADNLERAIACFQQALTVFTLDAFPQYWAMTQNNLGKAYSERIRGERADNLERAIACFQQALTIRTLDAFPVDWATTQNNLGEAYRNRILGKRADNLERTIACFQKALGVFTKEEFPYEWALIQAHLALAYIKRVKGKKAKNIEQAIAYFQKALGVFTKEEFPYEWALRQAHLALAYIARIKKEKADNLEQAIICCEKALRVLREEEYPYEWGITQNNLGNAYIARIKGEKAENLEEAISCYQKALRVRTEKDFPYEWAGTQNNLGAAYSERIKGEKAENLEEAISCYQKALRVRTEKDFPYEWAETQSNLGNIYGDRIKGEKAENLEEAISCYQKALRVRTEEDFPYEWSETQNNLASTYSDRIKGENAENIETAIACCQQALRVRTEKDFPYEWATAQVNLGGAYWKRIRGEKAENIETAIAFYQQALQVFTEEDFPIEWAKTQNSLGAAYWNRIKGEKAENLETAITCLRESLKVYTRDAFPYGWANTQNNLGKAYGDRIKGEKAENLETAIACYRESLKVYIPDAFPLECLRTTSNLGELAFREGNWKLAIEADKSAIEAIEFSRSWAMTPQSKQEVMEASIDVYHNIVQAYLNTEQNSFALEYVERSKTRNLVELMTTRDLKPKGDFSPAILEELKCLRNEIRTEQISLANQEGTYSALSRLGQPSQLSLPDRTCLKQLQQELDELIKRDISPIDPTFSLTQKVETIPFSDIQSLIDERTAIVEWYITGEKILTFFVTHHHPEPQVWQSSTEDLTNLVNWEKEYLESYDTNLQQWIIELETRLQKLAKILHLDKIISLVPKECSRLILIPHLLLHIFPLHALPVSPQLGRRAGGEGKYLLDLFPRGVQYAPSCQLLKLAQNQQRPDFRNLFAIQNPTEDLIYTDLEVETIRSFFPNAEVLAKESASEASLKLHQNLPLANCVHFSCHGTFNTISPLESHLVLAEDEANTEDGYLTLAEIFELSLQQCRLVTLSACETGFILPSLSDEYIGLPNGFLFAGSPSVVSSLWTVNDLSTAFLMIKFYQNLTSGGGGVPVAIALQTAQQWLRDATKEKLQEWVKKLSLNSTKKGTIRRQINYKMTGEKPFNSPYHWAAFTAVGK